MNISSNESENIITILGGLIVVYNKILIEKLATIGIGKLWYLDPPESRIQRSRDQQNRYKDKLDKISVNEVALMTLSAYEAFYLINDLKIVTIQESDGSELLACMLFAKIASWNIAFARDYLAYKYFKAAGWTVRDGLRYASVFVLYEGSVSRFHSKYTANDIRRYNESQSLSWSSFSSKSRLAGQVNKKMILYDFNVPKNIDDIILNSAECLNNIQFKMIEINRWKPTLNTNNSTVSYNLKKRKKH